MRRGRYMERTYVVAHGDLVATVLLSGSWMPATRETQAEEPDSDVISVRRGGAEIEAASLSDDEARALCLVALQMDDH